MAADCTHWDCIHLDCIRWGCSPAAVADTVAAAAAAVALAHLGTRSLDSVAVAVVASSQQLHPFPCRPVRTQAVAWAVVVVLGHRCLDTAGDCRA